MQYKFFIWFWRALKNRGNKSRREAETVCGEQVEKKEKERENKFRWKL